jgi:hypothetical protein
MLQNGVVDINAEHSVPVDGEAVRCGSPHALAVDAFREVQNSVSAAAFNGGKPLRAIALQHADVNGATNVRNRFVQLRLDAALSVAAEALPLAGEGKPRGL